MWAQEASEKYHALREDKNKEIDRLDDEVVRSGMDLAWAWN